MPRSVATGVRRLTGMNAEAISTMTQSVIESTAARPAAVDRGRALDNAELAWVRSGALGAAPSG